MKLKLILLFACIATQIARGETSLAEKNAAENAAIKKEWESWNAPFPPFRLIGNIHYVGASGISSFLITTPEGHILIDTGLETTVPRVRESVTKLGFRLTDIKVILNKTFIEQAERKFIVQFDSEYKSASEKRALGN